jgi:hypothetical protein
MKRLTFAVIFGILILAVPQVEAGTLYEPVADFSLSSNPSDQWRYLYDTGTGPQLLTEPVINFATTGANAWFNGLAMPDSVATIKNVTASPITISGNIVLPPNLLGMDPEIEKSDVTRWTAPSAGTWSISGLFQGIDTSQLDHTVDILENSTTVLLAPTSVSTFGQTVGFSTSVALAQGDTIDFIVNGATVFSGAATGLSATIQLAGVPEPSSITIAMMGGLMLGMSGCYRRIRRA